MARARTLGELGEFAMIDRIAALAERGALPRGVALGIGDDAALLRPAAGEDVAVSTDAFVQDVHFRLVGEDPVAVGRRALVASLSDLAAMGARPLGCTLALAAPSSLELSLLTSLLRGLVREARQNGCPLVGGNLSSARELSLSLTVVGAVKRGAALRRDATRSGDRIFVTGILGRTALARQEAAASGRLLSVVPTARLAAGRALARLSLLPAVRGRVACIDLSDGLAADLPHLLASRSLGARIEPDKLPRPRGFERRCRAAGLDPIETLVAGGEDYELLFALRGAWADADRLARRLGTPVTEIGLVQRSPGIEGLPEGGWRHFTGRGGG